MKMIYLFGSNYWLNDYRLMASSHLQILGLFCQVVRERIVDAIEEFTAANMITPQVLFRDVFDMKIAGFVEELKTSTMANNKRTNDFLWSSISRNTILTGLRSNYNIMYELENFLYTFYSILYQSLNKSCNCRQNDMCFHQVAIYNWTGRTGVNLSTIFGDVSYDPPLLFEVPGMMVGCYPYTSLLQSTLQCFYQQSCLRRLEKFIPGFSLISPISSWSSRFTENTTVNELFIQLFVESWNNQSDFSAYFQACSPQSCSYSYDRRFNWIYVLITLVGLFGGLKIITYSAAPIVMWIVRRLQKILRRRYHNTNDQIITVSVDLI